MNYKEKRIKYMIVQNTLSGLFYAECLKLPDSRVAQMDPNCSYNLCLYFQIAMSVFSKYFGKIRTPQAGEKVYKDECAFSFDNPVSV